MSANTDVEGSFTKAGVLRWASGPEWVDSAFLTNIGSAAPAQLGSARLPPSRSWGGREEGREEKKRMTVFPASAQGVRLFRWLVLRAWPALLSALSSPSSSRAQPPLAGRQRGSAGEGKHRKKGVGVAVEGEEKMRKTRTKAQVLKNKIRFFYISIQLYIYFFFFTPGSLFAVLWNKRSPSRASGFVKFLREQPLWDKLNHKAAYTAVAQLHSSLLLNFHFWPVRMQFMFFFQASCKKHSHVNLNRSAVFSRPHQQRYGIPTLILNIFPNTCLSTVDRKNSMEI